MKKSILIIIGLFFTLNLFSQKIKYSKSFQEKLQQTTIDIFTPTEGKYKSKRSAKNDYQPIDHTIQSKKEGIEIRYAIIPYQATDTRTQAPHVDFMRLVSSTASNEEEKATVTVHAIEETLLKEKFNADWGSIAYYQPKGKFAGYKHCRLVSLYKEGKGLVHTFFLFDEPSRSLDNRLYSLKFTTEI